MISVALEADRICIDAPARLADVIARIPGLKAERGTDRWVGTPTPALMFAIAADLAKLDGFSPSPAVTKLIREFKAERDAAGTIPDPICAKLEDHEQEVSRNMRAMPDPVSRLVPGAAILRQEVSPENGKHAGAQRQDLSGDSGQEGGRPAGSGGGADLPQAQREARASDRGRGDAGQTAPAGRGGASPGREQAEQRPEQPAGDDAVGTHSPAPRLYEHQRTGVARLLRGGCLLGDEMGVGKSCQAATAAWIAGGAVLVVAPNSMKHRWAREFELWAPGYRTFVLEGSAAQKRKTLDAAAEAWNQGLPVMVSTNWESLRTLSRLAPYGSTKRTEKEQEAGPLNSLISWNVVIADEAHRAKDPKSKQTRALWAVAQGARYRWALTGTPTLNTPGDLWAIGRFYDPDTYGDSRHKWHNRFVDYIETQWGPKDIGLRKDRRPEFNAWFDMNFIRRTKDEVLDLPPITYQTRELELTPKQRAAYNRMVDEMIVAVEGGVLMATDPLALLTRLSQIASATPVVDELDVVGLGLPSNKVAALLEILEEGDGQLAVFAQSRKLIELAEGELLRKGIDTVSITGRVQAAQRDMNVSTFQGGGARVALCTLGAGSEGINLYAADTAVFLQRSYAYGMNQQAESRIHRNGQEADKVTIIDLVSKDTLDEDVIEALHSKAGMAEQVLRDQARQMLRKVGK